METTGKKHTKNLDTLVDDINDILVGISSGKAPDVKEEQIDKFLNNTKLALLDWLQPRKSSGKGLRMSVIGRPARQLWYDNHLQRDDKEEVYDPSTQLKFLYGHLLEHLLLFLVDVAGHKVTDQQKKVKVEDVNVIWTVRLTEKLLMLSLHLLCHSRNLRMELCMKMTHSDTLHKSQVMSTMKALIMVDYLQ